MSKIKSMELEDQIKKEIMGDFVNFLSDLESKEDTISFFMNNLTDIEILMIAKRFQIAKRIKEGRESQKISDDLMVGRGTITRINNELNINEAYVSLLEKYIYQNYETGTFKQKYKTGLSRYPGHDFAMKVLGIDYINKKIFGE